jgi:F0F1-type ATP synthase assembly protein I
MKEYAKYVGLGFELAACILLFLGIGYWIDEKLGFERPRFLIAGIFVGFAGAAILMFHTISQIGKPKDPK